jgi:multidrug resistance efflux pump
MLRCASTRADQQRSDEDLKRYRALAVANYVSNQKLEVAQADQRKGARRRRPR